MEEESENIQAARESLKPQFLTTAEWRKANAQTALVYVFIDIAESLRKIAKSIGRE